MKLEEIPLKHEYEEGVMRLGVSRIIAEAGFIPPTFTPELKTETHTCRHESLSAEIVWDMEKRTLELKFGKEIKDENKEELIDRYLHFFSHSQISTSPDQMSKLYWNFLDNTCRKNREYQ